MSTATSALPLLALTGCTASASCPPTRSCGDARWLEQGAVIDRRQVLAHANAAAAPGLPDDLASRDALPVTPRGVWLRFDGRAFAGRPVERAVLALAPHPSWRPTHTPTRLAVRDVSAPWRAADVAAGHPQPPGGEVSTVTLPAGMRAPVRVDVTAQVRAWARRDEGGLMLETDGADAVFVGVGGGELAARPRLEVVLR